MYYIVAVQYNIVNLLLKIVIFKGRFSYSLFFDFLLCFYYTLGFLNSQYKTLDFLKFVVLY